MTSIENTAHVVPEQPTTVREAAEQYTGRGFAVTPLVPSGKAAKLREWPTLRIPLDDFDRYFDPNDGIGILTGKLSGGLVDVDIDSKIALRVARHPGMLPKTSLVAGRAAKPNSHRLYLPESEMKHETFTGKAVSGVIIEILSDGHQMAAPPGTVGDGDQKVWHEYGDAARIDADDLRQAVAEVAVVAELIAIWPRQGGGVRHRAYLALAGGLVNAGVDPLRIETMTDVLIAETGDHEPDDRRRPQTGRRGHDREGGRGADDWLADALRLDRCQRFDQRHHGLARGHGCRSRRHPSECPGHARRLGPSDRERVAGVRRGE